MTQSSTASAETDLTRIAQKIGTEIAAKHALDVDRDARFPREAIDALRNAKLVSAFVPKEFGGRGCSVSELSSMCFVLGQSCASTAMVFAMHHIQVACIVRHGIESPFFRSYLSEIVEKELLLASATTEVGIGGDVRSSTCSIEPHDDGFRVHKQAPVISYGEHADDILVTARRAPDAATSDQVIVLARKGSGLTLEKVGSWDTLGMRGTCSLGFKLTYQGPREHIVPFPYAEISAQTMLPVSHIVWASLWLGIATDAISRARAFIRGEARKKPGTTPPGALRLAEAMSTLQTMRATVESATREYEAKMGDREELSSMGFAIRMNNLKVAASELVVSVVSQAMGICGIYGYKSDTPFSLGRHLRDAHGAALMVANDRILGANASLLLVTKDD